MKKNFKKNKIVLTTILGLALISTASIAYATWNFGIEKKEQDVPGLGIDVDTATDKSIVLTANSKQKTINVGEKADVTSNSYVNVTKYENALQLKLDEFKISFTKGTVTPSKIKFALIDEKNINSIEIKADPADYFGREAITYNYIALDVIELDLSTASLYAETESNGITVWDITDKTINFKWGNYFEYTYTTTDGSKTTSTPSEFWDQKIKEKADDNAKLEAIQKAKAERTQMETALKGTDKSLTLRITVETAA